jgi:hypothetical protein
MCIERCIASHRRCLCAITLYYLQFADMILAKKRLHRLDFIDNLLQKNFFQLFFADKLLMFN